MRSFFIFLVWQYHSKFIINLKKLVVWKLHKYYNIKIRKSLVITTAEVVKASAGSHSGFFVGATPQNDNEDELYDDADVSEDDFAEFDIDEDDEAPNPKVNIKMWYIAIQRVISCDLRSVNN